MATLTTLQVLAEPRRQERLDPLWDGGRPGGAAADEPARRVQAPAGAQGRRARRGPRRRAAPPVPDSSRTAGRARRMARQLSRALGRPPRPARGAPGPKEERM